MNISRFRKKTLIITILILAVIALLFVLYGDIIPVLNGEFSLEAWEKYPKLRYKMITDMEAEIDIWNLSREKILEVLGTKNTTIMDDTLIRYLIDTRGFFPKWYEITFTDDGRVKEILRIVD